MPEILESARQVTLDANVKLANIHSNSEWDSKPDAVLYDAALLRKHHATQVSLRSSCDDNDLSKISFDIDPSIEFLELLSTEMSDLDDFDDEELAQLVVIEDKIYRASEELSAFCENTWILEGTSFSRAGMIKILFYGKHTDESLWFSLTDIDLKV
jgi:hypothetical protein